MKLTTPTEAQIQRAILQYLRLLGAFAVRVNTDATKIGDRFIRFNDAVGCPDILVCLGGRFVGVEVKRKGGRLRPEQAACMDSIRKAGGLAFVARSVDDVHAALTAEELV